ncbi:MAG: PEGA domain-containing protein [Pseudomonadota bacterium]
MRPHLLSLVVALGLATGCAHKVKVVTTPPGAMVIVDGTKVGTSPVVYEESILPGNHRIEARLQGYRSARVEVQRTEIEWWWVAGGIGGCVLCSGPMCLVGASLANLSLCPACLGCLLTQNPGTLLAIFTAPSLLTVPLLSLGALIGVAPLGLLALSERSPDVVKLTLQPER